MEARSISLVAVAGLVFSTLMFFSNAHAVPTTGDYYTYQYGERDGAVDGGTYTDYLSSGWLAPGTDGDGQFNDYSYNKTTQEESLTITRIAVSTDGGGTGDEVFSGSLNATSSLGLASEPTSSNPYSPGDPNIGYLGDGLLNGEDGWVDPLYFQEEEDLYELMGETASGWIHLWGAEYDVGLGGSYSIVDASGASAIDLYQDGDAKGDYNAIDLEDLLQISFACDSGGECNAGTWSLWVDPDTVQIVEDLLGVRAFDHLLIELKYGSASSEGGWALYDWDFPYMLEQAALYEAVNGVGSSGFDLANFDFETAYTFEGTWQTESGQELSYVNIWAHDPTGAEEVPEPATIALLGLSLAGIGFARKKKQALRT
jgi:hypothetical protein